MQNNPSRHRSTIIPTCFAPLSLSDPSPQGKCLEHGHLRFLWRQPPASTMPGKCSSLVDKERYKVSKSQRTCRWYLLQRKVGSLVCLCFLFFPIPPPSKKSSTVLNYSRTVDCIAVICQRPKRTSLFLCVKTDEAGKEDGKLWHQRWHCEYLMAFTGTATDQSQKHCTHSYSQNTSLAKKDWLMFD